MKLARTIRFDESDANIFARPADPGEWATTGAFEFSNHDAKMLTGKTRQAFANGWLGLDSFGRATFVAVARIEPREYEDLVEHLATYFVAAYGAPGMDAARRAATEELGFMREICEDGEVNDLLVVQRELVDTGVREQFRKISPQQADMDLVAMHATLDPLPGEET